MEKRTADGEAIIIWSHRIGSFRFGDDGSVIGLDLLPAARDAIETLEASGARIRLLLPALLEASESDLQRFVPSGWHVAKLERRSLAEALAPAQDATRKRGILVASDRTQRAAGAASGFDAWPDAAAAALARRHGRLLFVRLIGDLARLQADGEFVPYFIERRPDGTAMALGLATAGAIARAIVRGWSVAVLPLPVQTHDPLLVHIDRADGAAAKVLQQADVLFSEGRRALVAIGPEVANDELDLHGAHGHYIALWPDVTLFDRGFEPGRHDAEVAEVLSEVPKNLIKLERIRPELDILKWLIPGCPASAAQFEIDLNRYTGVASLDAAGPIVSRHYRHADNARAVDALMLDLANMGYCPVRHAFEFNGRTLHNVIADLPGRGHFVLSPDIHERLRHILIRHPFPDPPDPWIGGISEVLGKEWIERVGLHRMPPIVARRRLEHALGFRAWSAWWQRRCPLRGFGAEIVIVGCHLDSTASSTPGYDATTDAAPGRDDDASGLVATLSMARWFRAHYRGALTHTVRFCFFNAEESGLVGSRAYASFLKSHSAPVRAVFCSDMMGFNSDANRLFEVHAGYTDPAVRDLSVPLADAVAAWAAALGALAPAQIYKGTSSFGGADRNLVDGAINRSDHASFHEQGYPAVLVSEDFFANLASEPGSDPNPNYHRQTDTTVDHAYAADITCAVAKTVRQFAS